MKTQGWWTACKASMSMAAWVCTAALVMSASAMAEGGPAWAYPVADKEQPPAPDGNTKARVPNSALTYQLKEIDNLFEPPIWFPEHNVGMPRVVQYGAQPGVRACAACHLTSGQGHPESGHISGLSVNYFKRQIQDFRSGDRTDKVWMTAMARAMTDKDIEESAQWFAKIKPIPWVKVVEADTIPKSYFNKSRKRLAVPGGGTEPLGERIAEFPQEPERVLLRDPYAGFVAYVPKGSLAKGKELVTQGAGKTVMCIACHGADLKGVGDVPRIAGVSPLYTVRQMYAFKTGSRKGTYAAQMQPVTANLQDADITAIAAYLASLAP
ncbi:MAG: cytochrome C [Burkholderiales bacterium]|nr:MAG: cytochrome C [Burkholderiales bacterium]